MIGSHGVGFAAKVNLGNLAIAQVGTKSGGLFAQIHHHLVAIHAIGIARKVVDDGGLSELSTRLQARIKHGIEVSPAGIKCCGVARRTTTND